MNDGEVIKIKELNLELIAPSTNNFMESDQGGSKIVVVGNLERARPR